MAPPPFSASMSKHFEHCPCGWSSWKKSDLNSQGRRFGSLSLQIAQVRVNTCVKNLSCVLSDVCSTCFYKIKFVQKAARDQMLRYHEKIAVYVKI